MNKKVLTLCAGFLLAGGMLSSLSAEKLAEVAGDNMYHKIVRIAYANKADTWTKETSYLNENNGSFGVSATESDYWKVDLVNGRYQLTNLNGDVLTVDNANTFAENLVTIEGEEYTQLEIETNSKYVGIDLTSGIGGFWDFAVRNRGDYNVQANVFDAQETSLQLNNGNFSAVEDGKYYAITNGGEAQYKAVKVKEGVYSFVENTVNGDGDALELGGADKFTLVEIGGQTGQYLFKVGDLFVSNANGTSKLVQTEAEATIFSFEEITNMSALTVKQLCYYELDGFTLNITYKNDKGVDVAVAGDPFEGHLTPMTYTGMGFVKAADNERNFFLQNEDGKYIVAVKHAGSTDERNSIYTFTTVDQNTLLHFLSGANNEKKNAYYGLFAAESKDYLLNKEKLDVLDRLVVHLPNTKIETGSDVTNSSNFSEATIARFNIKGTWTLAAQINNTLDDVKVAVKGASLVEAKNLLQQKKFFTVTRKATTNKLLKNGVYTANTQAQKGEETIFSDVAVVSSYGNPLEGQWAITYDAAENKYTFTNRENTDVKFTLNGKLMYTTDTANEYRYDWYTNGVFQSTETLVIEAVKEHKANDGYQRLSNLKNVKFNIGYSSETFKGNAWFTENHEGTNNHTIGLDIDQENALTFTATEYANAKKKVETPAHGYMYQPSDSIYVISTIGYIDPIKGYQTDKDTLKVVSYSFVNQWDEPLIYAGTRDKYVSSVNKKVPAQKFALRYDGEKLNLRPVTLDRTYKYADNNNLYNEFNNNADLQKMYSGDTNNGILDNTGLYSRTENDRFVVESTDAPMYRRVVNGIDTVSIYRNGNDKEVLFEDGKFLGLDNAVQFEINPAFLVDTAYVPADTYRPQYMLTVGATKHEGVMWCPEHGVNATCEHAVKLPDWIEGRYLVNLKDTAIAWDKANKHSAANPYINSEKYYRLGFVQAKHIGDSLLINAAEPTAADTINVGTEDFNVAKFAFRYVDAAAGTFVIETANYNRLNEYFPGVKNGEAYVKWMNGVIVAVNDIDDADVFNMNEEYVGNPTANEEINANGAVSVVTENGAVVVKDAEGKNVIVSTILGKVVANEVLTSDNAKIAAPAGIVVVSVEGESFKVVVK